MLLEEIGMENRMSNSVQGFFQVSGLLKLQQVDDGAMLRNSNTYEAATRLSADLVLR